MGLPGPGGEHGNSRSRDLELRFLVRTEDVVFGPQWQALIITLIQIQNGTRFSQKARILDRDPGSVKPGTNGVLFEDTPQRAPGDRHGGL